MSILALERHRRNPGPLARLSPLNPARIVANNKAPSVVGATIGTQIFNSASSATNVLTETINVGGAAAGIVTGIQFVSDLYYCGKGVMPAKEVGRRIVRNSTVNATAVVGGAGGSAVGGALGTVVFPGMGTVVGSVVGGVCGSVGFGKLMDDKFQDWWRGYKIVYVQDNQKILESSLQYFHFNPDDFSDAELVTMELAQQRYHELAKVHHPDKGGTKEEWIILTNNFAVVTDAIRKRDKKLPKNSKKNQIQKLKQELQMQREQLEKEKQAMQREIQLLRSNIRQLKENNQNQINYSNDNEIAGGDLVEVAL